MQIRFTMNHKGNPPGKLAEAEIQFQTGPLAGLKLIGFAVWARRDGRGSSVTFPARQYSVNGERRSFALLRPLVDSEPQERLREYILAAYADKEQQDAAINHDDEPAIDHKAPPAPVYTISPSEPIGLADLINRPHKPTPAPVAVTPAPIQPAIDF